MPESVRISFKKTTDFSLADTVNVAIYLLQGLVVTDGLVGGRVAQATDTRLQEGGRGSDTGPYTVLFTDPYTVSYFE